MLQRLCNDSFAFWRGTEALHMRAQAASFETGADPLLAVEAAAEGLGWSALRSAPEELLLAAALPSLNVQFSVQWLAGEELLQITAMWDMRIPRERRAAAAALVQLVNTRLPLGHFELWDDDGVVVLRHAQMALPGSGADEEQATRLLQRLSEACARYHPAFQFVVWAGKEPRAALDACLFETLGEA